jgi:hypothetical protein
LWFDRPITELSHAVLIGKLSQWLFGHGPRRLPEQSSSAADAHYYQVVISASRQLAGRPRDTWIYDNVFHTPAADPWLGLLPRTSFTGLPGDGVVLP